ncbi:Hypothetical protein EMIHUDRAFT_246384 [Emiliania huxleyi CCMP1516]|uniref:Uncharacterized protein n=2 Tax=Emiliania huxleyi TaxID=2903 RepID=A0A0D3ISH2_EMIH1|nr:Hypothetical protein EMIHUDRAFT_246384 [Emiliania huxleyi CCMP1516]EOD14207.1 Hypothetical protein EMIHUDRAFT_246384 [Emiliania huxleyi CCMP1516]|eukprot:XP_005766636.1 Hypothetical protein EMIHUDRAFT_246384 [Emiliania huxleyi CCMP1516]
MVHELRAGGLPPPTAEVLARLLLRSLAEQESRSKARQSCRLSQQVTLESQHASLQREMETSGSEAGCAGWLRCASRGAVSNIGATAQRPPEERTDTRYEIERTQAASRLDLNLFQGRMREEHAKTHERTTEAFARSIRGREKGDLLRYSVGTMAALTGLGLTALRLLM